MYVFHDGVLKSSILASYTAGDVSFTVKRVEDELIIGLSDGSPDQVITLRDANASNKATVKLDVMACPCCGRNCLSLYLYRGIIKCRQCHGLAMDRLGRIAKWERQLADAKAHYAKYEVLRGIPSVKCTGATWIKQYKWSLKIGYATTPKHLRDRIARLERQIAAERLRLWRSAPNSGVTDTCTEDFGASTMLTTGEKASVTTLNATCN
jgi:hypothetical protein